jgi:HD-GYP domain-containing protein (c-di-GMP phosphodiesterase class II)
VAIADVFDALTSKRPYKEAFPTEVSLAIVKQGRGTHFDPDVADAFFGIQDEIINIKKQHSEDIRNITEMTDLNALLVQHNLLKKDQRIL